MKRRSVTLIWSVRTSRSCTITEDRSSGAKFGCPAPRPHPHAETLSEPGGQLDAEEREEQKQQLSSLIREFPLAGVDWPGGILADEMGLGKTVEVLALILCNTRQNLEHVVLTLPVGRSVNYFVPLPPLERQRTIKHEVRPKEKIIYPAVREMLLTAIKEMRFGKGASINEIFAYVQTMYKYDTLKNRNHIKKILTKLISENIVEQIKGRGLAGSFKLGKHYKEKKKKPATPRIKSVDKATPRRTSRRVSGQEKEASQTSYMTASDSEDNVDPPLLTEELKCESDSLIDSENPPQKMSVDITDEDDKETTNRPQQETTEDIHVESSESDPTQNSKPEPETSTRASEILFNTPDYRFECICGELGLVDYKPRVQCLNCLLWQHAECENLETTPFYCPHCLVAMTPVSTGATLIISPSFICHQWVDEINRHIHTSSLRVLVYQGVKRHSFIQPHILAEQDVVITTYDVLHTEQNYVDIPHSNSKDGCRFRNQKHYMAIPSPLVAVEWWRVCLDEAQMVECTTAKAAEKALRLTSVNRWCVSGTPVQRGLEDLYGLVLFLGVDPYWVKYWWDQLLYRPYRHGNVNLQCHWSTTRAICQKRCHRLDPNPSSNRRDPLAQLLSSRGTLLPPSA